MRKLPTLSERHTDPRGYPPGVAYMDGQYLPMQEAKLSDLDYGFLHSDATYDVAHVWKGAFFRLNDHLDRFFRSVDMLHMSIPYDKAQVTEIQDVPMLGVISGFYPFTGNLRFCWLSVAHTVMQVSWTSGQTYSRALRTDFIPAMCPCALLVLMSAYAGTG